MVTLFRMLMVLSGWMVALNTPVGAAASNAQSVVRSSGHLSAKPDPMTIPRSSAQSSGCGGWQGSAGSGRPMLCNIQYVAPAPGYPPGQYYAPGRGYPGNYAPVPPPAQYYAPPYYERRFYPPPVYVQPYYGNRFCARHPWRCG